MKVLEKSKKVRIVRTHSLRRFTNSLRTINWGNNPSVYLRVSYGKKECNFGCLCTFYNDGWYENEKDLLAVFIAFNSED